VCSPAALGDPIGQAASRLCVVGPSRKCKSQKNEAAQAASSPSSKSQCSTAALALCGRLLAGQRIGPERRDLPRAFRHCGRGLTLALRRHAAACRAGNPVGIAEPHAHERVLFGPRILHRDFLLRLQCVGPRNRRRSLDAAAHGCGACTFQRHSVMAGTSGASLSALLATLLLTTLATLLLTLAAALVLATLLPTLLAGLLLLLIGLLLLALS